MGPGGYRGYSETDYETKKRLVEDNTALNALNDKLWKDLQYRIRQVHKLEAENILLKKEVEKIYSRFEIIDLWDGINYQKSWLK